MLPGICKVGKPWEGMTVHTSEEVWPCDGTVLTMLTHIVWERFCMSAVDCGEVCILVNYIWVTMCTHMHLEYNKLSMSATGPDCNQPLCWEGTQL